jgi:hypothetical protein
MSTSESVLNEMEVAATNLSDSIKKYRALLVEENLHPTSQGQNVTNCEVSRSVLSNGTSPVA